MTNLPPQYIIDRIWERIDKSGECWLWTGTIHNDRPVILYRIKGKQYYEHPRRVIYQLTRGEIPEKQHVLSTCKNYLCLRPEHFYLGNGHATPENREKLRGNALKLFQSPEFQKKHAEGSHRRWDNPEIRKKMSQAHRGRVTSDETKEKLSLSTKGRPKSEEWKIKASEAAKRRWAKVDADARREHTNKATAAAQNSVAMTSIEQAVKLILDSLGIEYVYQKAMGPYFVDFYIPSQKLAIECDGEYWHSRPGMPEHDRRRDHWMATHKIQVARLTEKQIKEDVRKYILQALGL